MCLSRLDLSRQSKPHSRHTAFFSSGVFIFFLPNILATPPSVGYLDIGTLRFFANYIVTLRVYLQKIRVLLVVFYRQASSERCAFSDKFTRADRI